MITGVALVCVWVLDYDEARDFYVKRLGLDFAMDAPMDGGGRWLVVRSPHQPSTPIMLAVPGPPVLDEERAEQVRALIATGFLSAGALATDDCRATYEELKARGVEVTEEPSERFYGIDAAFRDPFGNHWRLTPAEGGMTMAKVISADGTAIVFERSGDGPPVILVSGASCDRKANAALAALLAPDLTVLNYDRRGRGASGDTAPYAVAREVEDIAALVAAAGGSAALFGASSGAVLAMEAAASGLGITRLAMWEPPFQVDNDGPRRSREYVARLTELLSAGRRGDAAALFMKQVGLPDEFIAQTRTQPWWPAMEELAQTLAYDAAVMGDGLVPVERAASVMVPTMVIDGGASPPWADQAARAVSAVIPDVARRTLDGQDHNFAAEALAPVLKEFLG